MSEEQSGAKIDPFETTTFKHDEAQYHRAARVHGSLEDATLAVNAFNKDLIALREKHGISDLVGMLQVHTAVGSRRCYVFYGAAAIQAELAAMCSDTALEHAMKLLEETAYLKGVQEGAKLSGNLDALRQAVEAGKTVKTDSTGL